MYTHSLMYTYNPYTQQGVVVFFKLNDWWAVQAGLTNGNDIALWNKDSKPTGMAGVQWISKRNNDSIYLVVNAVNNGKYGYSNVQHFVGTWSHRFNKRVHITSVRNHWWRGSQDSSIDHMA